MKRGKRQVIDLGSQPVSSQAEQAPVQPNTFHQYQSHFSQPQVSQKASIETQELMRPKPSDVFVTESKPVIDDAEEKRKKIQLLKQKYLKKSQSENPQMQSSIQQALQPPKPTSTQYQSVIHQQKALQTQNFHLRPLNGKIATQKSPNLSSQSLSLGQTSKSVFKQQNIPSQSKNQQDHSLPNDSSDAMKTQILPKQQVPKPQTKANSRNPPPPPLIKKPNLPSPVLNPNSNSTQSNPIIKQQLIIEVSEENSKTQRSDNFSFAPPSLYAKETTKINQKEIQSVTPPVNSRDAQNMSPPPFNTKDGQNVPPSPMNRNMKQILNKKLTQQRQIPKPPVKVNTQIEQFEQPCQTNDFTPANPSLGETKDKNGDLQQLNNQMDNEYSDEWDNKKEIVKIGSSIKKVEKADVNKFVGEWLGSPELTLKQLLPELRETIEFYCLKKNLAVQIASGNPAFTPMIRQLVECFILNNKVEYSAEQKRVAESVSLDFFYSSPTSFSDIFLILMIKTGQQYLRKYQAALEDKLQHYLARVLFYKNHLLSEETNAFVEFCIQSNMVKESNFLLFLMLSDSPQLLNFIYASEVQLLEHKLALLSFCKLNLKNKAFLPLYLKLISSIEVQLGRQGLVEKILDHLKDLDVPENLYQFTKQLKLKLLKNYSQSNSNPTPNADNSSQPTSTEAKDSGLFGYFNLNKAIDKIKTSTEKALGAIEKPKKPQEQEPKDQIVYDPIRKRYIINGQIPEDQNETQEPTTNQIKPKVPPPPPLGGNRKAPPPMHNKKPGPRIAGNRYV